MNRDPWGESVQQGYVRRAIYLWSNAPDNPTRGERLFVGAVLLALVLLAGLQPR